MLAACAAGLSGHDDGRGELSTTQSVSCCRGCSRIALPAQTQQLDTQWCCISSGAYQAVT